MSFKGYLKASKLIIKEEKNYLVIQFFLLMIFMIYNVVYNSITIDNEYMMVSVTQAFIPFLGTLASTDILDKWYNGNLYVSIIDRNPLKYTFFMNCVFIVAQSAIYAVLIKQKAANINHMIRISLLTILICQTSVIFVVFVKSIIMTYFIVSLVIYAFCFIRSSLYYYENNDLNRQFLAESLGLVCILMVVNRIVLCVHAQIHAKPVYNRTGNHKEVPDEMCACGSHLKGDAADGIKQSAAHQVDDK